MTDGILSWLKTQRHHVNGRVLEVGSLDVNGSARSVISATEYIGVDMRTGKGVDIVCNSHDLISRFGEQSFDAVVCCDMLEHDNDPLASVKQMRGVLNPGCPLLLTSPRNGFAEHHHPRDYFRFMPHCYEDIFFIGMKDFKMITTKDGINCCIGWKPK